MSPENREAKLPKPQHHIDIAKLTATELKNKHKLTYSSWRNMKQRRKNLGATIHSDIEAFRDFLFHIGPRPDEHHTLDRIDNGDPEYAPGKCAWVTKVAQANNRSTTIILTVDGKSQPLTQWARETNQKPDTLRRRLKDNWPHDEVVYGRRKKRAGSPENWSKSWFPWLEYKKAKKWECLYRQAAGGELPTTYEEAYDFFYKRAYFDHEEAKLLGRDLFYKIEKIRSKNPEDSQLQELEILQKKNKKEVKDTGDAIKNAMKYIRLQRRKRSEESFY